MEKIDFRLEIIKYDEFSKMQREVWQTVDQVIQAYEEIGIDHYTLSHALLYAADKLRDRIKNNDKR